MIKRTLLLTLMAVAACRDAPGDAATSDPTLLTRELPFVYPPALYAAGVEGDVGLRLFIDSWWGGCESSKAQPTHESTRHEMSLLPRRSWIRRLQVRRYGQSTTNFRSRNFSTIVG